MGEIMNYYNEIKTKLIDNEIYNKVKDYSKEKHKVVTYYDIGKLLYEAGKSYGKDIIRQYAEKLMVEVGKKYNERTLRRMRQLYLFFERQKWSPMETRLTVSQITSPAERTTYNAKVGLMYVSDYGYAASPENWSTNMENLNTATNRDNNWMFMGLYEWTITRCSGNTEAAFYVSFTGDVDDHLSVYDVSGVRPSIYLNSDVAYVSGDGSQNSPFIIQ